MAKGARSKQMKKLRSAKRAQVTRLYETSRLKELSQRQQDPAYSLYQSMKQNKNAFLHPNDPTAQFPKLATPEYIDFRSSAIPEAAYACRGGKVKSKPKFEKMVLTTEEAVEREQEEEVKQKQIAMSKLEERLNGADYNAVEEALNMMSIGKKERCPILHKGISKKKRTNRSHKGTQF